MPDAVPRQLILGGGGNIDMVTGDFVAVFDTDEFAAVYDAVACSFFLDTAHNILEYLQAWPALSPCPVPPACLSLCRPCQQLRAVLSHVGPRPRGPRRCVVERRQDAALIVREPATRLFWSLEHAPAAASCDAVVAGLHECGPHCWIMRRPRTGRQQDGQVMHGRSCAACVPCATTRIITTAAHGWERDIMSTYRAGHRECACTCAICHPPRRWQWRRVSPAVVHSCRTQTP